MRAYGALTVAAVVRAYAKRAHIRAYASRKKPRGNVLRYSKRGGSRLHKRAVGADSRTDAGRLEAVDVHTTAAAVFACFAAYSAVYAFSFLSSTLNAPDISKRVYDVDKRLGQAPGGDSCSAEWHRWISGASEAQQAASAQLDQGARGTRCDILAEICPKDQGD